MTYLELVREPMIVKVGEFLKQEYKLTQETVNHYFEIFREFLSNWVRSLKTDGTHLDYEQVAEKIMYAVKVRTDI